MIGIYKITNPKGKIYIGQAIDINKRWKYCYFNLNCKKQIKLYNSLKKYGPENHKFEILEECLYEQLNEREIYWIKELKTVEEGLNLTYGGIGGKYSKESIKKLSNSKLKLNKNEVKLIKKFYLNEEYSTIELGKKYNVTQCTIIRYLRKEKVFMENPVEEYLNKNFEIIKKDYEILTTTQIAEKHGISEGAMLRFLKKTNIFIPLKNRIVR